MISEKAKHCIRTALEEFGVPFHEFFLATDFVVSLGLWEPLGYCSGILTFKTRTRYEVHVFETGGLYITPGFRVLVDIKEPWTKSFYYFATALETHGRPISTERTGPLPGPGIEEKA